MIAEHQVALDGPADSSQVDAVGDLYEYVRWHIDPLWRDDEQRIIRETGTWTRDAVLGDAVTAAIVAAAPATVLVSVPAPADEALLWPLELAFADGAPLAPGVPATVAVLLAGALGTIVAFRDEKRGALVQNVVPVPALAASQSNGGSVPLEFHTENAFHPHRPGLCSHA